MQNITINVHFGQNIPLCKLIVSSPHQHITPTLYVPIIIRIHIDNTKFAPFVAVSFITFCHIRLVRFCIIVHMYICICIYDCTFYMFLLNFVNYVFLQLCMFRSGYSVLLCGSVFCLCVNVYCTTAAGCQPNCS